MDSDRQATNLNVQHVRERELIDAEAVGQRLQAEAERTPEQQRVPAEPTQAEKDVHDLVQRMVPSLCVIQSTSR